MLLRPFVDNKDDMLLRPFVDNKDDMLLRQQHYNRAELGQ